MTNIQDITTLYREISPDDYYLIYYRQDTSEFYSLSGCFRPILFFFPLLDFFLLTGVAILASSLICLYRVLFGPTIVDRITGVNVIGTKTIALILIIGLIFKQVDMFIDIAFTYALINFIGTITFSKYFEKKGVHDGGPTE